MTIALRLTAIILIAVLSSACASPSASASGVEPSASSGGQAGWPPGCEPVDLRSPTGERVELSGDWAGAGVLVASDREVALLTQVVGCVYGSVTGSDPNTAAIIANLSGRLNSDFTIDTQVVLIRPPTTENSLAVSTMVMVIEWDTTGRLRLRELRDPGERPDRCRQDAFTCPDLIIWYRLGDGPLPS